MILASINKFSELLLIGQRIQAQILWGNRHKAYRPQTSQTYVDIEVDSQPKKKKKKKEKKVDIEVLQDLQCLDS